MNNLKSKHQLRVEKFMVLAKQEVPTTPTEPSEQVRLLRAKLILEEALETIKDGLGIDVWAHTKRLGVTTSVAITQAPLEHKSGTCITFSVEQLFNMEETIDGCCDLMVVTTGTLSALGVPDKPFQEEVDNNNLAKFGPGHSWRDDGKLLKPPGHKPPDIKGVLESLEAVSTQLTAYSPLPCECCGGDLQTGHQRFCKVELEAYKNDKFNEDLLEDELEDEEDSWPIPTKPVPPDITRLKEGGLKPRNYNQLNDV